MRSYIVEFDKKTIEFAIEYKVGEREAKGMIYDNLAKLLPPGTKREYYANRLSEPERFMSFSKK